MCRKEHLVVDNLYFIRKFLVSSTSMERFSAESDTTLFNPSQEHRALRESVKAFVKAEVEPQANEFNRKEKLNMELFKKTGDLGLLGLTVGEDYGGSGFDAVASCIVHEELSASDPAYCLAYLAHSLLFTNNLYFNGNEEQKMKYLPGCASGELIGGMCMSEPDAGTDVLGLSTNARKEGDKYVLNGRKMWITNGCVNDSTLGDVFLVYAKLSKDGESIKDSRKLSLFLVEKGTKGFSLGQRIKDKLGMRSSTTAELVFDNCEIPAENLVGNEGEAVVCMMRNLEIERVALAAMSVGIAKRSLEEMIRYANTRKAFNKNLASFGQIQRHIGRSYASFMAGRSLLYNVAAQLDLASSGNRLDTDAVKLFCGQMGKDVADSAIQVLGGNGYIGDYVVERLWRDAKLLEIGGGTMESHEKNIVREFKDFQEF